MLDFVLNLLLFFIITAVFVREVGVDLQRAGGVTSGAAESTEIPIRVRAGGEVEVDGRAVDVRSVRANVERLSAADAKRKGVLIVADRGARTGVVVAVVDQVRLGGVTDITFGTLE